jgi:hypothetical protein
MKTTLAIVSLVALAVIGGCESQAIAAEPKQEERMNTVTASATSSKSDFDFLEGSWHVVNKRLKKRHVQSNDWDEFPGELTMRRVLGGLGNVDQVDFPTKGWSGVTMRFFSPQSKQWSIYWVNSRDGLMQSPVVGSFNGNVGEFYGDDTDDGLAIYVRYRWTVIDKDHASWAQAFSLDRGKTWETNWTSDFTRVPARS